jgi:hypothetical protein
MFFIGDEDPGIGRSMTEAEAREFEPDGWPKECTCGFRFTSKSVFQLFNLTLFSRPDGNLVVLRNDDKIYGDAARRPGDMWDAYWMPVKGPDGKSLCVICPDGSEWWIDGPASNCDRKDDPIHRCWNRIGEPPNITVGKGYQGQSTCNAGAGSIMVKGYHGFLQNGAFTDAV